MTTTSRPSERKKRTSELTKAVIDLCTAYGGYAWRNANQPRIDPKTRKAFFPDKRSIGSPDVIAAMPGGVTLWIEIKVTPDKLRESQGKFAIEMRMRGHLYAVVKDNTDNLVKWLREPRFTITEAAKGEE